MSNDLREFLQAALECARENRDVVVAEVAQWNQTITELESKLRELSPDPEPVALAGVPTVRSLVREFIAGTGQPFCHADVVRALQKVLPAINPGTVRAELSYAHKAGLIDRFDGGMMKRKS